MQQIGGKKWGEIVPDPTDYIENNTVLCAWWKQKIDGEEESKFDTRKFLSLFWWRDERLCGTNVKMNICVQEGKRREWKKKKKKKEEKKVWKQTLERSANGKGNKPESGRHQQNTRNRQWKKKREKDGKPTESGSAQLNVIYWKYDPGSAESQNTHETFTKPTADGYTSRMRFFASSFDSTRRLLLLRYVLHADRFSFPLFPSLGIIHTWLTLLIFLLLYVFPPVDLITFAFSRPVAAPRVSPYQEMVFLYFGEKKKTQRHVDKSDSISYIPLHSITLSLLA